MALVLANHYKVRFLGTSTISIFEAAELSGLSDIDTIMAIKELRNCGYIVTNAKLPRDTQVEFSIPSITTLSAKVSYELPKWPQSCSAFKKLHTRIWRTTPETTEDLKKLAKHFKYKLIQHDDGDPVLFDLANQFQLSLVDLAFKQVVNFLMAEKHQAKCMATMRRKQRAAERLEQVATQ